MVLYKVYSHSKTEAKGQIESLQAALRDERKRYKKQSKILAEQRRLLTWL